MTRTIKLKGRMGELFGEEHRLNVKTIQEAMHAIDVMKGGLRRYIMECTDLGIKFTVQRGSEVKAYAKENIDDFIGEEEIGNFLDDDDIIITPVPAGAIFGKIFKAVFKKSNLLINYFNHIPNFDVHDTLCNDSNRACVICVS